MTLAEWQNANYSNRCKGTSYDEVTVIDAEGKEMLTWTDNDQKYNANVLKVESVDGGTLAILYTDWRENENKNQTLP